MVQSGNNKRKGAALIDREEKWCTFKSILDVLPGNLPSPPVQQYLEEVPMGMRGGPADFAAQAGVNGNVLVRQVQCLQDVMAQECTLKATLALLWLSVGGVFNHWPEGSMERFRDMLGETWYLVTLATVKEANNDRRFSDWVSAALPYIISQAIFRMLCDGFPEDKKLYSTHADRLMCKLTQVVHFETTGFQLTPDTVKRERRRLLQKHVIKSPHVNQREYLRGQRRQEMLESQNTNVGDQPLRFGDEDAQPLEETQLDHVMQALTETRNAPKSNRTGKENPTSSFSSGVPPELSVERYAHLSQQGGEMLAGQLQELAFIVGDVEDEEPPQEEVVMPASGHAPATPTGATNSNGGTPASGSRPGSRSQSHLIITVTHPQQGEEFPTSSRAASVCISEAGEVASELEMTGTKKAKNLMSPTNILSRSNSTAWTTSRRASMLAAAKFNSLKAQAQTRERKVREEKARKLRQESLLRKICDDKLPEELCTRELSTTWVSPCQMTLMNEEDRDLLNKPSAEAHMLSMAAMSLPGRSRSTPSRARDGSASPRSNGPGAGAARDDHIVRPRGSSTGHSRANSMVGHSRANSTVGFETSGSGGTLPRVHSAGGGLHGSRVNRVWAMRSEVITLEPPPRISAKLAMRRMEEQAKASKAMSFALYMKEYDIFTDQLKRSMDGSRLRDEEDAVLRKTDKLLSGPPKRRLAPDDLRMRTGTKPQSSQG